MDGSGRPGARSTTFATGLWTGFGTDMSFAEGPRIPYMFCNMLFSVRIVATFCNML